VTDAILRVLPKGKVGIRISPVSPANDAEDSQPEKVFFHLVEELNKRGIAYIHAIEGATGGPRDNRPFDFAALRRTFNGAFMANNGYTRELAIETVERGDADLIAFGVPYIANPDLVARLRANAPLNKPDKARFYGGGAEGYTDYPFLDQADSAE
jgi:N-ethylmaleimide reductase